jgi:hypothetical protein
MYEQSENLLNVAIEIRELLKLLAEPAIAQRDEKSRTAIRQLAGKSATKQKAILLMDGSRQQKEIVAMAKIDSSDLSKLVKLLRNAQLLTSNEKPEVQIPLPNNFFDAGANE